MTTRVARVALYGEFGCGNLGNEGTLDAVLGYLRERHPDVELTCICRCVESARTRFAIAATGITGPRPDRRWGGRAGRAMYLAQAKVADLRRMVRLMGEFDAVVVPGTGILEDSLHVRAWGVPWELFCLGLAARLRRTPLAYLSIGATAARSRATAVLFGAALRSASYRSFRDEPSRRAAAGFRVRVTDAPVYADLAFALHSERDHEPDAPRDEVVIGVMAYRGSSPDSARGRQIRDQYVERLVALTRSLVERGRTVRLIVGDSADQSVATAVLDAVARDDAVQQHVRYSPATTLLEVVTQMTRASVVVASRFHNIVCASLLGVPSISLGHGPKNDTLQRALGLGDFCHRIEDFDVDFVLSQIDDLQKTATDRQAEITRTVEEFRRKVDRQFADLDLILPTTTTGK